MNLRLHHEQRQLSFAALVVAPSGASSGLKLRAGDPETPLANSPSIPGRIISPRMSMTTLAKLLSRFQRETVLDLTGLSGDYNIRLEYSPDNTAAAPEAEGPLGPSLYSALTKQLGLKLEARKGLVQVLVIDSASKVPTEN